MEKKFLTQIAEYISKLPSNEIEELVVILPNRRAGLLLQNNLTRTINKQGWLPEIVSIEDFVFQQSGMQKAGAVDMIFELYAIHLKQNHTESDSFDDFGNFAPALLRDFNDIDNYLADAKVVFSFLKEARALQKWQPDEQKSGRIEKNYLHFYTQLEHYYHDFKKQLRQQGRAYYGMAIRSLAENTVQLPSDKHFLIAGFNAQSKAEEELLAALLKNKNSHFFIDGDSYYLENKSQEAGLHLRKQVQKAKYDIKQIVSNGFKAPKKIHIHGLSGDYAMVKYAAQILQSKTKSHEWTADESAIILSNEELLFPLLDALPKEDFPFNITMAYPLTNTTAFALLQQLFACFESAERLASKNNQKRFLIHHQIFTRLLNNPFIQDHYFKLSQKLKQHITKENISLISIQRLIQGLELKDDELTFLEYFPENLGEAHEYLDSIGKVLKHFISKEKNSLNREILTQLHGLIPELLFKIEKYQVKETISVLRKILHSMVQFMGLPFQSTPFEGVQIMGSLETRSLDFKQVIYLSFNEGHIPPSNSFSSYILPEIRYHFGLPSPNDDDAIVAYHFYRSIQRSQEVFLLYNQSQGKMGGGELSRFGQQLLSEAPDLIVDKNDEGKALAKTISIAIPSFHQNQALRVEKDQMLMEKIEELMSNPEKGVSPSSLITYITCPLKFYFQKIAHLREPLEVEEQIEANTRGSAIHETLQDLYDAERLSHNAFNEDFFEKALQDYDKILAEKYRNHYKSGDIKHGYNLVLSELDRHLIRNFLIQDKEYSRQIEDVLTEQDLESYFVMQANGKQIKIRLHGQADRIDRKNGVLRVIDYKTGSMNETLKIDEFGKNNELFEKMFTTTKSGKAFQLLCYALLFAENHPEEQSILPVIAALKTKKIFFELKTKNGYVNREIIGEFKQELIKLFTEILDPAIAFNATEDESSCKYCEYARICGK